MATALYTVPMHASGPVPADVLTGAACQGKDDLFFPENRSSGVYEEARKICKGCPVRQRCLDYALPIAGLHGIWAGLDEQQRGIERRKRGYRDWHPKGGGR